MAMRPWRALFRIYKWSETQNIECECRIEREKSNKSNDITRGSLAPTTAHLHRWSASIRLPKWTVCIFVFRLSFFSLLFVIFSVCRITIKEPNALKGFKLNYRVCYSDDGKVGEFYHFVFRCSVAPTRHESGCATTWTNSTPLKYPSHFTFGLFSSSLDSNWGFGVECGRKLSHSIQIDLSSVGAWAPASSQFSVQLK